MQLERDIAAAVHDAINEGQTPGAVVLVGRGDDVLYHEAFGKRMTTPEDRPMLPDTVFDLASVTKPVSTATAIMQLVENGWILLRDPVSRYLPGFVGEGREDATIRHLLTHAAGIPAYKNYLSAFGENVPAEERRPQVVADICTLPLLYPVGTSFTYTCLGYILLASIVEAVSGRPLDEYARDNIFEPLGMTDTCFSPPEAWYERCAATEPLPEGVLLGVVHDENARYLQGVGGNAGLFSTAADLSRYMRALLNEDGLDGTRVLAPASVALMVSPQSEVPGGVRSLGWDVRSPYSPQIRGDLFPSGSIGHSGYTGTSVLADPESGTYLIILANRVHFGRDKAVARLRESVANVVGACVLPRRPRFVYTPAQPVQTGLDVLAASSFAAIKGKRVGLISNHTGIDSRRRHILDLLFGCDEVEVRAILSPEHGFAGLLDEKVPSGSHGSGIPIHSLYGEHQAPTPEMLEGLDALIYDIADVGVRFYTYTTTMTLCMKAAAEAGIEFIVLDRPNPIDGLTVEGPTLDEPYKTLAAWHPIPLRHGLTSGELALWSNDQYDFTCDLQVIKCEGWRRPDWFDQTGLPWVNPSPNMRNLKQAILYPAIGTLESANISVGRGTDTPFEVLGAPWIDGARLADRLNALELPELSFIPIEFTPDTREFVGELCGGVYIMLGDRMGLEPVAAAAHIARLLREMWPETFTYQKLKHLLGSRRRVDMIAEMRPAEEIIASWQSDEKEFRAKRGPYLLYT